MGLDGGIDFALISTAES